MESKYALRLDDRGDTNYVETYNGNTCLSNLIECFSKGYKYYNTNSKK